MKTQSAVPSSLAANVPIWRPWRVNWSAIWIGALTGVAASVVLGLVCTSVGATSVRSMSWTTVSKLDVALAVLAAFFAFAAAGWAAARVAGIPYAEPAILHAVCAWLVALPVMLVLLSLGSGPAFGGWYGGAVGTSSIAPSAVASTEMLRTMALASVTAILIGLLGSVIGGWIASGEPMSFTHHRGRSTVWSQPERNTLA